MRFCLLNIWICCLVVGMACTNSSQHNQQNIQVPNKYVAVDDKDFAQQKMLLLYQNQPFSGYVFQLDSLQKDTVLLAGYYNGLQHGLFKKWYRPKQLMEYRVFARGEKDGMQISWWPNGNKRFEFTAKHDAYEGEMKEWDIEGKLFHLAHYKNGQEEGEQKMWYSNGKIRANYVMIDGRRYGLLGTKNCKNVSIVFLVCSSWCFWGCKQPQSKKPLQLPYYNQPDFTPLFLQTKEEVQTKVPHTIADFALLNQDSTIITQKSIEGKIHVANFVFTSCGSICPNMTANLNLVNKHFAQSSNVVLLSYSVTPWIDKPHVLKRYKAQYNIQNPQWHFLTGNKAQIYALARQSYFAEEDIGFTKDSTEFLHTEHFILVDQHKKIRGIYNGTLQTEMTQLIADIESLQKE